MALVNELDKENEKKSTRSLPRFTASFPYLLPPLSNLVLSISVADTPPRNVTDLYVPPCRLTELTSDLLSEASSFFFPPPPFFFTAFVRRERERRGRGVYPRGRFDSTDLLFVEVERVEISKKFYENEIINANLKMIVYYRFLIFFKAKLYALISFFRARFFSTRTARTAQTHNDDEKRQFSLVSFRNVRQEILTKEVNIITSTVKPSNINLEIQKTFSVTAKRNETSDKKRNFTVLIPVQLSYGQR